MPLFAAREWAHPDGMRFWPKPDQRNNSTKEKADSSWEKKNWDYIFITIKTGFFLPPQETTDCNCQLCTGFPSNFIRIEAHAYRTIQLPNENHHFEQYHKAIRPTRQRYFTAYEMNSQPEKSASPVLNQIVALFTAEGAWFSCGKEWGLDVGRGMLMLSIRLCLPSTLQVSHHSFYGKCAGTDYRWLLRNNTKWQWLRLGVCIRRWAAKWAPSKSPFVHTPSQIIFIGFAWCSEMFFVIFFLVIQVLDCQISGLMPLI